MPGRADATENREGLEILLTPEDDDWHTPETSARYEHETVWFWFFSPEHRMGGWVYHYARPNLGLCGGTVMVFDDSAWIPIEVPYYVNYYNMPFDPAWDLRDMRFPNGTSIETVEPLKHYRIGYRDRGIIELALEWKECLPPWVSTYGTGKPRHIDHVGHVTGSLRLHGEDVPIDCYAMRDRTWQHVRPEAWKDGTGGIPYFNACAGPRLAWHGTAPDGYLVIDGVRRQLVESKYHRVRDPEHGFMREIHVEGTDRARRRFEAHGRSVARIAQHIPGVHGVVWVHLVEYELNGTRCWGKDQDAWPVHNWSAFYRRRILGLRDAREDQLHGAGI